MSDAGGEVRAAKAAGPEARPAGLSAGSARPAEDTAPLLSIRDLAVSFAGRDHGRRVPAVEAVSLTIYPGQTVAVVGESGSGKSVTALSVLGLLPAAARVERGSIAFRGRDGAVRDLLALDGASLRAVRGNEIAMIFQEPMTSLNPVFSVGDQIAEAVRTHRGAGRREAEAAAAEALRAVGLADPERRLRAYPHEFSGGMRQRVMIAMALACWPRLLLADEPTTALDVTIQAQILDLLGRLKRERGLAVMLITHALGVVAEQADVVCVMYRGRVVEYAGVYDLFDRPLHPYTRALLACIPRIDGPIGPAAGRLATVAEVVSSANPGHDLPGGLKAWWPGRDSALGAMLVEVLPRHWVAAISEGRSPCGPPDVRAFRDPAALPAAAAPATG